MGYLDEGNPAVLDYLLKKKKAEEDYANQTSNLPEAALFSNLGDAIAGKQVGSGNSYFDKLKKDAKAETVDKVATDYDLGRKLKADSQADADSASDNDINSDSSKAYQALLVKMGMKPEIAGKMNAAQAKKASPVLEKMYAIDQAKLARQDALNAKAGEKADKRQEKLDERELKLAVPGYSRTGEVLPKDEEAVKFRKATAVSEQLVKKLNRMKALVKDKGSFEYGGTAGQEMESLATEIQLLGKSPELYELGVLAGPDLTLLEKITSDPSSLSSLFTRDATRKTQLDSQIKSIEQKLQATSKSLGYAKQGSAPKQQVAEQGKPAMKSATAASKPLKVIQNGHEYTLNPETGEYE